MKYFSPFGRLRLWLIGIGCPWILLITGYYNNTFHLQYQVLSTKTDFEFTIWSKTFRPPSKGCTAIKARNLTDEFFRLIRDSSGCPKQEWLQDISYFSQRSSNRKRLFVNIGFNKGYNFAMWMNLFAPITGITPMIWHTFLQKFGVDFCGPCDDCKEIFVSNRYSQSSSADPSDIVMVGVDINRRNVKLISDIISYGQSIDKLNFRGVSLLGMHGAGTNETGTTLSTRPCKPGDEHCALTPTGRIEVRGITVDELVYKLIKDKWITVEGDTTLSANLFHFSKSFERASAHVRQKDDSNSHSSILFGSHLPPKRRFLRQESKQDSNHNMDLPIVDILEIDTEGHDPAVLQGASELIRRRGIRCIMFEYHGLGLWKSVQLEDVVHVLDLHDYDCYFQGHSRLWPITGKSSVATVMCHLLDLRPSRRNFTNIYICLL